MTVCPIAIVAGCAKCPAFKICPLKGVLGDAPPAAKAAAPTPASRATKPRSPRPRAKAAKK